MWADVDGVAVVTLYVSAGFVPAGVDGDYLHLRRELPARG